MFKKEKIKILIVIGISISLFCVFLLTSYIESKEISLLLEVTGETNKVEIKEETNKKIILEIEEKKYETDIEKEISVYEFMERLKQEEKITFKDKTYTGMGKLIEEINGSKNDGNKYWIYSVNGKKAQVGVSNYKIKAGDVVSWKYEKNAN